MLITKKEAIKEGYIFYFTGKPCKHGHISERLVKGGACRTCKNLYGEQYKKDNSEKVKESIRKCHKKNYTTEKRRQSYINNVETEILNRAKFRSRKHGLEFNLERSDIIIPEYCPVLGIKIDFSDIKSSPSLDRIDNTKGYIKGNICVISNHANRLKNNGTIDEFEKIINYMKKLKNE